jgi:glycosyltransferase involved in cell wall biosynthesis
MSTESPRLLVSVVVIGRNEGERLARCLHSVAAMVREGFATETMYVDSGSTDHSVTLAESLGAHVIPLHAVRPTAAMGRNAGWRAARGEIVLFLDGDTVLDPRFVVDSLAAFADAPVAVVWGHRRELYPERSLYNRVLDLDWIYAAGPATFCGGDALFRRSVLEATGGFDETLIAGEEPELCRRITGLGMHILHLDLPMTKHDLDIHHFSQYWRRATRAGHAFAEVSTRFAHSDDQFWLQDARRNRTRGVVLLAAPVIAALLTLALRSVWPIALFLAAAGLVVLRTAIKARWKTQDRGTLLLYAVHSHLQQIPIFVGQMQFFSNRRRGERAALVEYKRP